MDTAEPSEVFAQIGVEGITRLVHAFYQRVPTDPLLGPLYPPEDLAGAEERLRDFLLFRCGGLPRYLETRGHPRLRMRHAPYAISSPLRDRWVELMDQAFAEVNLPPDAAVVLQKFLAHTATFLQNTLDEPSV